MRLEHLLAFGLVLLGLWLVLRSWRRKRLLSVLRGRRRCAGRWEWESEHQRTANGRKHKGWHVYRMTDIKGRVRYTGRTDDLHERFRAHGKTLRSAPWERWEAFSCDSERDAQRTELALYLAHKGRHLDTKIRPGQSRG